MDGAQETGQPAGSDARLDSDFRTPSTAHEIEVIMARQLAGYLALPIVIVDPAHVVIYYNEPAEQMVGRSFNEAGPIPWAEWAQDFQFTDEAERPIPSTEMPMALALRHRHLAHRRFWLRGLNGVRHHMAETAIPLRSMAGRFLGAVGVFDDVEP